MHWCALCVHATWDHLPVVGFCTSTIEHVFQVAGALHLHPFGRQQTVPSSPSSKYVFRFYVCGRVAWCDLAAARLGYACEWTSDEIDGGWDHASAWIVLIRYLCIINAIGWLLVLFLLPEMIAHRVMKTAWFKEWERRWPTAIDRLQNLAGALMILMLKLACLIGRVLIFILCCWVCQYKFVSLEWQTCHNVF